MYIIKEWFCKNCARVFITQKEQDPKYCPFCKSEDLKCSEKDQAVISANRYLAKKFSHNLSNWHKKRTGGFMATDLKELRITIEKVIKRTEILEKTLKAVLEVWKYEADQGDGIHKNDCRLYNHAMKLLDPNYEPE